MQKMDKMVYMCMYSIVHILHEGSPEGSVPTVHLNVQDPDHHIHEEEAQQGQFDATTSIPHYSGTDQISLEPH